MHVSKEILMFKFGLQRGIKTVLVLFLLGLSAEILLPAVASARAFGGRSSGRSSGFGYRKAPSQPAPGNSNNYNRQYGNNPNGAYGQPPSNRGSFLRGMAGGLAGGLLGGMLFSSLGHAAGSGGMGAGGIGFLDILLVAGLAYLGFRWWKSRQQQPAPAYAYQGDQTYGRPDEPLRVGQYRTPEAYPIDGDVAEDIFFRVQGAWTRRDLSSLKGLLTAEMHETLEREADDLRRAQRINRLENISVRRTEVQDSWQEEDKNYSMVRFTANLLDYTVDEKSGQTVEGSDIVPVKFEEDWIFVKNVGALSWQLAGIQQVHV
jgi:predicted lipid-binding transport protein (Tim44 family)